MPFCPVFSPLLKCYWLFKKLDQLSYTVSDVLYLLLLHGFTCSFVPFIISWKLDVTAKVLSLFRLTFCSGCSIGDVVYCTSHHNWMHVVMGVFFCILILILEEYSEVSNFNPCCFLPFLLLQSLKKQKAILKLLF